jgi:cysteine synthase
MNHALASALNLDRVHTAAALLERTRSIANLRPLIEADPGIVDTILRAMDLASVAATRRHAPTLALIVSRTGGAAMRVYRECDSTVRGKRALFLMTQPRGADHGNHAD